MILAILSQKNRELISKYSEFTVEKWYMGQWKTTSCKALLISLVTDKILQKRVGVSLDFPRKFDFWYEIWQRPDDHTMFHLSTAAYDPRPFTHG